MAGHYCEKPFQTLPSRFDHLVRKPIGKDFAGKCGDINAGRLALQDIAECFKVRIPPPHKRMPQLEGRYIGFANNLVVSIHLPSKSMRLWVANLNLKEALRDTVHLLNRLLPSG